MSQVNPADFIRPRLSAGTRLNGIYEIEHPIGLGGMGEIYKGHLVETGDPVAIKMMLPELSENQVAFTLFRKEASALHHIQHDAIVRYYVFTVEPVLKRPYLAMEYVDGRTLSNVIATDGPLNFEAAQALLCRVASGLQAVHEHGVIHRDISPDNIIIPNNDVRRAKIIDFGIARTTQHGTVIAGGFAGKFSYVSPEQLGLFGGDVTAKSDIYSLGLVIAEAITGRPLDMGGSQVELIEKRRKLPELGAIDLRFLPLLERMLQPDPANRPESMAAVAVWQFAAATANEPPLIVNIESKDRTTRGHGGWLYSTVAAGLIALAGGGAAVYFYGMAPRPSEPISTPDSRLTPSSPSQASDHASSKEQSATAVVGVGKPLTPSSPSQASDHASSKQQSATAVVGVGKPPTPSSPSQASNHASSQEQLATAAVGGGIPKEIRQYIAQYDGGNCFFITPLAVTEHAAALEGFGSSVEPFQKFNDAFHQAIGFEPDIGLHQTTRQQCPALAFLSKLHATSFRAPHLDIDRERVRNGEVLSGIVDRYGSWNVALILVSDAGLVQDISGLLKPSTDAKTFKLGMRRAGNSAGQQPQLLIALTSPSPANTLPPGRTADAEQFFTQLLEQAEKTKTPLAAAPRFFMLGD